MARQLKGRLGSFWRICAGFLQWCGLAGLAAAVLCFSPVPWRVYRWLSTDPAQAANPSFIVVLGGGGIPSETGLMRTYEAAAVAARFPAATVVVALPAEGAPETSSTGRMKAELVMRGVAADRILLEPQGRNTREQALNVAKMIPGAETNTVLVVTSPEHVKRAVLSFRKAGLGGTSGSPAFEESADYELNYDQKDLGGAERPGPDIGNRPMLRYQFWNNLGYLERSARELAALAYYKWMGWI